MRENEKIEIIKSMLDGAEEEGDAVLSANAGVRLNDEGELTDSFIQERDDAENRQYR